MGQEVNLGDKLSYLIQMEKAAGEQLEKEEKYRKLLAEEKANHQRGAAVYPVVAAVMLGIAILGIVLMIMMDPHIDPDQVVVDHDSDGFEYEHHVYGNTDLGGVIMFTIGLVGLIVCGPGALVFGIKGKRCVSRRTGMEDWRDGKWRSYEEMQGISEEHTAKLERDRVQMQLDIQLTKEAIEERAIRQTKAEIPVEEERIGIEELMQAKQIQPKLEALPEGNPLAKTWEDS